MTAARFFVPLAVSLVLCGAWPAAADKPLAEAEVTLTRAGGQVHLLTGPGGNIAVFAGADGVLMVDDKFAPLAPKIASAIKGLGKGDVSWVINTHWHGDHTGGNAHFGKNAVIVAHANVRKKLAVDQISGTGKEVKAQPPEGLPVVTFPEQLSLHLNGEEIRLVHLPNGHTDGDLLVHFMGSKVWHLGDHFFNGRFPFVDTKHGGTLAGYLANVRRVLKALPKDAIIIPGHGPLATRQDLQTWIDTVEKSVNYIRAQKKKGLSLKAAQKAGLPAEYGEYGSGFITTDKWIATVWAAR